MKVWFRHMVTLTMGLLFFYAVSFIVIYTTIMSPNVASAIITAGGSPIGQVNASIGALFPIPAVLWLVGVVLSKWIAF